MAQLYRTAWLVLLWSLAGAAHAGPVSDAPVLDPLQPPGRMVDVGGHRLHIYCIGPVSAPSVVFDAGLGGFSLDWWHVQRALAREARVCAYDRAGYGWSDQGPSPRVTEMIAAELEVLLQRAAVAPPYVVVGHSFGGYNVGYFAAMRPRDIAGIVLVDASHPQQAERLPAVPTQVEAQQRGTLVTFFDPRTLHAYYPEDMWYVMGALMSSGKALRTQQRELMNFSASAAQVLQIGRLPDVPLVVVSRGRRVWPETPLGDALERTWQELQTELAAGTPGGRQVRAENSGHLVHLEQPQVVVAAVRDVLEQACRRRGACDAATR